MAAKKQQAGGKPAESGPVDEKIALLRVFTQHLSLVEAKLWGTQLFLAEKGQFKADEYAAWLKQHKAQLDDAQRAFYARITESLKEEKLI